MATVIKPSIRLSEIAEYLRVPYCGDADSIITGMATLESAAAGQLSFLANPKYRSDLHKTQASVVILHPSLQGECPVSCLLSEQPYLSFAQASALFDNGLELEAGVHESAVVHVSAQLGEGVRIAANVSIAENVVIGAGSIIGAGTSVGANSRVGKDCLLHANVSIYHDVHIGDRVRIHSATVIGSDGFGFAPRISKKASTEKEPEGQVSGWQRIYQLGGVRVGNDVEIGACTSIDRGALENTIISDSVIIDNQVQIGHNVIIGKYTAIVACSAIAGSTRIGERCTLAGRVSIVGHITIADGTHFTANTQVTKSIAEAGSFSSGTPMQTTRDWRKSAVRFSQLEQLNKRVIELEKRLSEQDKQCD